MGIEVLRGRKYCKEVILWQRKGIKTPLIIKNKIGLSRNIKVLLTIKNKMGLNRGIKAPLIIKNRIGLSRSVA